MLSFVFFVSFPTVQALFVLRQRFLLMKTKVLTEDFFSETNWLSRSINDCNEVQILLNTYFSVLLILMVFRQVCSCQVYQMGLKTERGEGCGGKLH